MILAYLLSFSLLVTSVIKVTDIFIKTNKSLDEKRSIFIKKTRSFHKKSKNETGSITLMGALLTVMISALLMFFALKFKIELDEARYRKESYLCFQYLNIETENYILDMAKFNIALRSLAIAMTSVVVTKEAIELFKATKLIRNARHFYYIKNLLSNPFCKDKTSSLSYLKNFPFEISPTFTLITNADETTKLKGSKWSVTHYKNPKGIRFKKSFCLQAQFEARGAFFPNLAVKTREISMEDFSKLKCLSGFP